MARIKVKYVLYVLALCVVLRIIDQSGLLLYYNAKDYYKEFKYPLEGDITEPMEKLKSRQEPTHTFGGVKPINDHDYMFIRQPKSNDDDGEDCHRNISLVYLVKSPMDHFKQREVIRKTWGYEKRFSDVTVKTVFLLGSPASHDQELLSQLKHEYDKFADIVQGDFVDSYFNDTIKTMMGLRWATEICPNSRFYAFFDDDYYVSTRNMLRFLRNPVNYPRYLEEDVIHFDGGGANMRQLKQLVDFDLPDDIKLYAGYVFQSRPMRHKFSKWHLSLEEYPFHMLPPYVTAGGVVLSKEALQDFYYASYFVKRFKFDDVYMGLIAKKLDIEPFHCDEFHFWRKSSTLPKTYRYVVASHEFSDPDELERVWTKQKEAGNA